MPTSYSPSSSQDPQNPPPLLLPPPPQTTISSSRRLPPPCWTQHETTALIDSYRDKWYSLRRGNLRVTHWQEVADDVTHRCHVTSGGAPPKTSIQCRHKMEKLRKRYRAEIHRAACNPNGHRIPSSWVHFKQMDLMEKGSSFSDPAGDPINQDQDNDENRVRVKISGRVKSPGRFIRSISGSGKDLGDGYGKLGVGIGKNGNGSGGGGRRGKEVAGNGDDPVVEMVAAIKRLGDGFVRIERMKMDMVREVELMRMEMEMKRTEMILESQERLVDSFSDAILEKKNKKIRMATQES